MCCMAGGSDHKTINYVNFFKLNFRLGQLKHKLNLELLFFMNLKSLRLNYTRDLATIKVKEFQNLNAISHSLENSEQLRIDNDDLFKRSHEQALTVNKLNSDLGYINSQRNKVECLNCIRKKQSISTETLLSADENSGKNLRPVLRRPLKSKK